MDRSVHLLPIIRVLAVVLAAIGLARAWPLLQRLLLDWDSAPLFAGLAIVLLISGLAGIVGVWRRRSYGFFAYALFAGLLTLLFGQALVPVILQTIPVDLRTLGVIVINGLIVSVLAWAQWQKLRSIA